MSRASRSEVFSRALIEGLCLTLQKHYQNQTRQKPKLQAIQAIMASLEVYWQAFPIQLDPREGDRVVAAINWFDDLQSQDPDLSRPEVLIALVMALTERIKEVTQGLKRETAERLAGEIQGLYDWFDQGGRKHEWICLGGNYADRILGREI